MKLEVILALFNSFSPFQAWERARVMYAHHILDEMNTQIGTCSVILYGSLFLKDYG